MIFVNRKETVLLVHVTQRERLCPEHAERENQHVFPVESLRLNLHRFVLLLQREVLVCAERTDSWSLRNHICVLLDAEHRILTPLDLGSKISQRGGIEFQTKLGCCLTDEFRLRVEHLWRWNTGELGPKELQLR